MARIAAFNRCRNMATITPDAIFNTAFNMGWNGHRALGKTGQWIDVPDSLPYCSRCRSFGFGRYCSECGAKMTNYDDYGQNQYCVSAKKVKQ